MNKKTPLIKTYLDELKNQIDENSNLTYVLLRLDDSNVDILNNLLQEKSRINYIFNNYHFDKPITDYKGNEWSLCITGFKHGAKKNSPRKIGLLAYRSGYPIDFKTRVFYDSDTINKYAYSKEEKEGVVQFITSSINKYLENTTNYNSNVNYIKPIRKIKSKT
jgi:hypothetical protein